MNDDAAHETDLLAEAAVAPIKPGTVVGLGTGRAASRAVRALAARNDAARLRLRCVPTSEATAKLARSLGLTLLPLRDAFQIDYLFDGADEVDPELRMIKGAGGAMTREKIAAHAANERVYLINDSKLVERLGERVRVPVELLEDALGPTTLRLEWLGLDPKLRMTHDGSHYQTDNGNPILDVKPPADRPIDELDVALRLVPGVVGHGLFLHEADRVLIERPDGTIDVREQRESASLG